MPRASLAVRDRSSIIYHCLAPFHLRATDFRLLTLLGIPALPGISIVAKLAGHLSEPRELGCGDEPISFVSVIGNFSCRIFGHWSTGARQPKLSGFRPAFFTVLRPKRNC